MPDTPEKKTAKIRQDIADARAAAFSEEQQRKEQQLKKMQEEEALAFKMSPEATSETKFAPLPKAYQKDWIQLCAEYKKKFGLEPDETGALVFPDQETAILFFKEQAKAQLTFFATKYENNSPTDFHVFSCGDSTLYQGSYADIQRELKAACERDPTNKKTAEGLTLFNSLMPSITPNPASEMRGQIQGNRQSAKDDVTSKTLTDPSTTRR